MQRLAAIQEDRTDKDCSWFYRKLKGRKTMEERKKEVLRVYNRKTVKGQYPNGLAYSVHLSVTENEEECPLHNNYGLVFPKAWVNEDNVIVPSFGGADAFLDLN